MGGLTTTGRWVRGLIDLPRAEHPAKFSHEVLVEADHIITEEAEAQGRRLWIWDPMAGTGRAQRFTDAGHRVVTSELEPEWAQQSPGPTAVADATRPPFRDDGFDVVFCSCLEQSQRVLTNDLRWIPAGDVEVGDVLMAFDEHGGAGTGKASRRSWRRATVLRSVPKRVECVRVILENGDEIVTTPEHPWLASRYSYGGTTEWVPSTALMGSPGLGKTHSHRLGSRQAWFVHRQMTPWNARRSYDAGWLAGMFDGEGSLSIGTHGTPRLQICQVTGPLIDYVESLMADYGYQPNRIARAAVENRQKMINLYVTGGFQEMLKALGELRPRRLLAKWETLDVSCRTVATEKVGVVAVEPAGWRDIQEIETSEGTYFGEGYLMHNCSYGNRMHDHHDARDLCKHTMKRKGVPHTYPRAECPLCKGSGISPRNTYRHKLGRMPTRGSDSTLPWGDRYRRLHSRIMEAILDPLRGDGLIVWNTSNHLKTVETGGPKVIQRVNEWHLNEWMRLGCTVEQVVPAKTRRNRMGANRDARVDRELIAVLRAPAKVS